MLYFPKSSVRVKIFNSRLPLTGPHLPPLCYFCFCFYFFEIGNTNRAGGAEEGSEAGSALSREPDTGLDPRTLG